MTESAAVIEPPRAGQVRLPAALGPRLLFAAILGGWIGVLLCMAGAPLTGWLLAPIGAAAIITTAGEVLLRAFGVDRLRAWLPASFVAGVTAFSVAMLAPTLLLGWPAGAAFVLCAVLVAAAAGFGNGRLRQAPEMRWADAAVVLPFAVLVAFLCRHQIASVPTLMRSGVLPDWVDYYAHGTIIASFASPFAAGVGDIMLPGSARVFYHYGPFMLPAALAPIGGVSPLALATAILLPLGLLTGLCGLFALAAEWGGAGVALVAVWLVAVLPDAAQYGLRNGFYGFHWLVLAAPGSGYAIGSAALAWLCALPWFAGRRRGPLALAGGLLLATVMLRAHVALLMTPALTAAVALAAVPARWRIPVLLAGLALSLALTGLLLAEALGPAATALTRTGEFVRFAFGNGPARDAPSSVAAGVLLLVPAALGAWAVALPAVAWLEARAGHLGPADWVPALLCAVFLLLAVWAPTAANNDMTEYKQRHVVLLYAVVALWVATRALGLAGAGAWFAAWRPGRQIAAVGLVTMATMLALHGVDAARPSKVMPWASTFYAQSAEPGMPQAAAYLRDHARPDDMLMAGGTGAQARLTGPALELVSLTGMPSYVGRIEQALDTRSPAIAALVRSRAGQVAAIGHAPGQPEAERLMRAVGVRWLVVVAPDLPDWDAKGQAAQFHAGLAYVYDAAPP